MPADQPTVVFSNPVTRESSIDTRPLSQDFYSGDPVGGNDTGGVDPTAEGVRRGASSSHSTFEAPAGESLGSGPEGQPPQPSLAQAFTQNFLGHSPVWFKLSIVSFLICNVLIRVTLGTQLCAWAVLLEFIFTLACGLYCYPLQSGGLIVTEAFLLGLAKSKTMMHEVEVNLNVLLLVMFMVAAIHFLKNLLLWMFTKLLLGVESKILMSTLLMFMTAALSAFLDALSVAAVLVSVCTGILGVYFHVVADADLPVDDSHHEVRRCHRQLFQARVLVLLSR